MDTELVQLVWRRAGDCCEYCQLPSRVSSLPFQIDHIVARKHGGATDENNLALSCFYCNSHKGPNIAGLNARGEVTRLFHPRRDSWCDHFEWQGATLGARTEVGTATIAVLAINRPEYVALRQSLIDEGIFPPS